MLYEFLIIAVLNVAALAAILYFAGRGRDNKRLQDLQAQVWELQNQVDDLERQRS